MACRALTEHLYPLTAYELGKDFSLHRALQWGHLPQAITSKEPKQFLASYVSTYLREEIQQEGLTRNLDAFARFLEAASFSQGTVLNISSVARECSVHRKVVEQYFSILEDLLIAYQIPVFSRRAKRKLVAHPKFFLFDVGVYRYLRPKGPLDAEAEIDGPALETLVLQELLANNAYHGWNYKLHYWRTQTQEEVDFVLSGGSGSGFILI
jgi:predicted AAA+ superfamily ATPase